MKKNIKKFFGTIICLCVVSLLYAVNVKAEEKETSEVVITDGNQEYGRIYGAPYSDEDDSKWLTVELEGRGLRVVNDEGNDVVLIDKFGYVYINGQPYNPQPQEENSINRGFSYGFMYFLIVIALILGIYNLITKKK